MASRRASALRDGASAGRNALGMSLVEILIVLSIMASGAALVVPMVGGAGASTGDLKTAARQIAAGLRHARSEAIAQRRETLVTLDLEKKTFRVAREKRDIALPAKIDLKLFTAQSDLVNERQGAIRFFPDGGSNGGRVTVASGERKYEVDVDWLTGRVAILD